MTAARSAEVADAVRTFAHQVAHDVSQEGPSAWRKYLSQSPAFFLAAEGRVVFPNGASAAAGIQDLERAIKQIDLKWGDDLRVDPLTPDLAMVAATYREVRVSPAGERVEEAGYFSGLAEYLNGHWQLRNAHWSVSPPVGAGIQPARFQP